MYSLKFYLKDHAFQNMFYTPIYLMGIVYSIICFSRLINEEVDYSMVKFLIQLPLMVVAGFYYFQRLKKCFWVFQDIKKQELITDTYFIKSHSFMPCESDYSGAYKKICCIKKQGDKEQCFWWYRTDLIYPEFLSQGEQYEVTYYKYSHCVCDIKQITFKNKSKPKKKKVDIPKRKRIENYNNYLMNNLDGFIISTFICLVLPVIVYGIKKYISTNIMKNEYQSLLVLLNFIFVFFFLFLLYKVIRYIASFICEKRGKVSSKILTTISIPLKKTYLIKNKPNIFYMRLKGVNGKKIKLFFFSTDILGLGDLTEREGYMGYGNFIGLKYEIEYYKVCRVIKSMRLVEEPDETNQGTAELK